MRLRKVCPGRLHRTKYGGFVIWLAGCGVIFLVLNLYFGSNLVEEGVQQTELTALKLKAADLDSLIGPGNKMNNHHPRLINPHRPQDTKQICEHPKLDLLHDANKNAFYELDPLLCPGKTLFSVKDGQLSIDYNTLGSQKLSKCLYRGIERVNDRYSTYTESLERTSEPFEIVVKHDFFRIMCNTKETSEENSKQKRSTTLSKTKSVFNVSLHRNITQNSLQNISQTADDVNNTEYDAMYWDRDYNNGDEEFAEFDEFIAQVHPSQEVFSRIDGIMKTEKERQKDRMNVLIICLDSMSHLSFQRKLPVTYDYIKTTLGAYILEGYNIVGDATVANLLPLFTGKAQDELPETRADVPGSNFLDSYPLIWYTFEKYGYATLFGEDDPTISMFNLRLNGFEIQPTDHYLRTFWLTAWDSSVNENSMKYCLSDQPKHMYSLNYTRDFFNVYSNVSKFAFLMLSDLTHWDNNPGQYIDLDLKNFLADLKAKGHFENTLVGLMGDHGARYSKVRWTVQGKLEERLPMVALALPNSFKKKYPKLDTNFKKNVPKLTTPFDIHQTLLDLINLPKAGSLPSFSDRGISLFQTIPLNRTCASAGIDMHWCTCLTSEAIDPSSEHVKNSITEVMQFINKQTEPYRDLCAELELGSVKSASIVIPNEQVLRYRFSQDEDHRVANFSSKAKLDIAYYQVTFNTVPGDGMFEATVQANFLTSTYTVNADISRINMYGSQADCIVKKQPSLRKFCYCEKEQT